MGHGGSAFDRSYGGGSNALEEALAMKRAIMKAADDTPGPEFAIVEDYDFDKQRVDVCLKNFKDVTTIHDVPVMNRLGGMTVYQHFQTIKKDGEKKATVGLLLFTRSDSISSLDKRGFTPPDTRIVWTGESPVFIPLEALLVSEFTKESTVKDKTDVAGTNDDKIGPGDVAFVHESGSFLTFKKNGDVVLKAKGKFYFGDVDTNVADMKEVARKGDAVSVNIFTGSGTIDAGSSKVKSG